MTVRIVEVGPRDGLQNEAVAVPTEWKLRFIAELAASGLSEIEATSFVSPKWVPQLADADDLWPQLPIGPRYTALVPNLRGLDRALDLGVDRIAVFTAASDSFVQRNLNTTLAESLEGFRAVVERFRTQFPSGWVRGYVSTAFECPFAGRVEPSAVARVVEALLAMGVNEISLGDTIGVAVPHEVRTLLHEVGPLVAPSALNLHFHDTRGTAIANVAAALDRGYANFDASAGGLGGCPYAPGAGGNLATEDLVYFLERSGIPTGVDLDRLARSTESLESLLARPLTSKVRAAVRNTCPPQTAPQ